MNEFTTALADARRRYREDEYIAATKSLVQDELNGLDNTAKVEDTHYFNHSAIPDFVITWPGEKASRNVYLRGSYASIIAADDIDQIKSGDPIFLSLDQEQVGLTEAQEFVTTAPQDITLVTDVLAVEQVDGTPYEVESPLAGLVKANFVRGGKGLIDQERAELLVSATDPEHSSELVSIVRENFIQDAVLRMERTAAIVGLATGTDEFTAASELLRGRLSIAEIKAVLPWLLQQAADTTTVEFWQKIGSMVDFSDLENIADLLQGLDISTFVRANAGQWAAKRTYLGVAIDEVAEDGPSGRTGRWQFHNRTLSLTVGSQRLDVSSSGTILKGRETSAAPRWAPPLTTALTSFGIASVKLKGITRSVQIDAEQSDDIRGDVAEVAESLSDDYFVTEVSVRVDSPVEGSDPVDIHVPFSRSLAIADRPASIADLTRISLQVLNYQNPTTDDVVESLISAS